MNTMFRSRRAALAGVTASVLMSGLAMGILGAPEAHAATAVRPAHQINGVDCAGRDDFASADSGGTRYCWANRGYTAVYLGDIRQLCTGVNSVRFGVLEHWYSVTVKNLDYGPHNCINRNYHELVDIQIK